jgi:hypothetical protein
VPCSNDSTPSLSPSGKGNTAPGSPDAGAFAFSAAQRTTPPSPTQLSPQIVPLPHSATPASSGLHTTAAAHSPVQVHGISAARALSRPSPLGRATPARPPPTAAAAEPPVATPASVNTTSSIDTEKLLDDEDSADALRCATSATPSSRPPSEPTPVATSAPDAATAPQSPGAAVTTSLPAPRQREHFVGYPDGFESPRASEHGGIALAPGLARMFTRSADLDGATDAYVAARQGSLGRVSSGAAAVGEEQGAESVLARGAASEAHDAEAGAAELDVQDEEMSDEDENAEEVEEALTSQHAKEAGVDVDATCAEAAELPEAVPRCASSDAEAGSTAAKTPNLPQTAAKQPAPATPPASARRVTRASAAAAATPPPASAMPQTARRSTRKSQGSVAVVGAATTPLAPDHENERGDDRSSDDCDTPPTGVQVDAEAAEDKAAVTPPRPACAERRTAAHSLASKGDVPVTPSRELRALLQDRGTVDAYTSVRILSAGSALRAPA